MNRSVKQVAKHFLALVALFFCSFSYSNAQVVGIQPSPNSTYTTTPNLLNPTVNDWTGTIQGQNGGFVGGNTPAFNPQTNTIIFGYTTATAAQTIAINQALSGTGIQVGGYDYSWNINNDPATMQYGTLSGRVVLKDSGGNALQTYNYNYSQQSGGFITHSGTQWFPQDYSLSTLSNLEVSFTGKDARFWAGYYGPQVRNPNVSLRYTVDPCVSNPGFSPSCPGYNAVTSGNLFTGTTGTQAYAINQALSFAGAGALIHGFNYGYDYNVAGRQCGLLDLFGFCLTGWQYSDAGVATVITNSNSNILFSESNTHNGGNNGASGTYSKQFRFNNSLPSSALGGFAMSPWTLGNASITNMYSNAVYTPDPCVANPLSNSSCPGFAAAYLTQQCNANPLYNTSCPGYAAAFLTQQCTINPLYNQSCPGYASAYLNYQCSLNPLYAPQCPGYSTAYKTQQCSLDGLYATDCPNYAEAYAKKNILNISTDTTTTTTTKTVTTSTSEPSSTIGSDGTVSTTVSKTGDSNVDKAITTTTTTTNSAAAPAAPVQLSQPQQQPNSPTTVAAVSQEKKEEKKDATTTGSTGGPSSSTTASSSTASSSKDQPKTARQELQERRETAAKAKAIEDGKNLAENMGKSVDMEQQKMVQNVVLQAMAFVPGFDAYNKVILIDRPFYRPEDIYRGQVNVDNKVLSRRMFGPSDQLHNEMVEAQYKK